jgi:hypothetical protein
MIYRKHSVIHCHVAVGLKPQAQVTKSAKAGSKPIQSRMKRFPMLLRINKLNPHLTASGAVRGGHLAEKVILCSLVLVKSAAGVQFEDATQSAKPLKLSKKY